MTIGRLAPLLSLALAGCATASPARGLLRVVIPALPSAPAPRILAQVFIDDAFVGPAGSELSLRAGFHRVEVRAEGYLTAYRELTLVRDQRLTLDVPLHPDLDEHDAEATPP